ncbi:hypothetical protein EKD04_004375 [Chloroflexales bacterium ZM16-3]|nr:hypothetical protein [Chloroflexales bacterium ZM16-3]
MQVLSETTPIAQQSYGHPYLIFFSELDGEGALDLLARPGLLSELVSSSYGVALAIRDLTPDLASAVRLLNSSGVQVVAWLQLPQSEGIWFHMQNYPQAIERYRSFRVWSRDQGLIFHAVGIDIEPPSSELDRIQRWGLRDLARRLWLAHENVLFAAARVAYADLIGEIHHDGYEVHAYQLPILADDRRAGTTLIQRAFDIVGLPADVEVLMCYSSLPIDALRNDIGGTLITSYGPSADSIGVGAISGSAADSSADDLPPLSGDALERDLLLAARHTDVIYVFSLEGCVERGLLPRIGQINWEAEPAISPWKRLSVGAIRALILIALLTSRFGGRLVAWLGWGLFVIVLIRRARAALTRSRT